MNIVGFTLTGTRVTQPLRTLAKSTGGNYFSAASGDSLLQALSIATSRYPYNVCDSRGRVVATGTVDAPVQEVAPGMYKVVVYARDRAPSESVRLRASRDTVVTLTADAGMLSLRNSDERRPSWDNRSTTA